MAASELILQRCKEATILNIFCSNPTLPGKSIDTTKYCTVQTDPKKLNLLCLV